MSSFCPVKKRVLVVIEQPSNCLKNRIWASYSFFINQKENYTYRHINDGSSIKNLGWIVIITMTLQHKRENKKKRRILMNMGIVVWCPFFTVHMIVFICRVIASDQFILPLSIYMDGSASYKYEKMFFIIRTFSHPSSSIYIVSLTCTILIHYKYKCWSQYKEEEEKKNETKQMKKKLYCSRT